MYISPVHCSQEVTMLVLSRRIGESVCVGPGVTIQIVETRGGHVRLAIDAPADVRIRRGELASLAADSPQAIAVREPAA